MTIALENYSLFEGKVILVTKRILKIGWVFLNQSIFDPNESVLLSAKNVHI